MAIITINLLISIKNFAPESSIHIFTFVSLASELSLLKPGKGKVNS